MTERTIQNLDEARRSITRDRITGAFLAFVTPGEDPVEAFRRCVDRLRAQEADPVTFTLRHGELGFTYNPGTRTVTTTASPTPLSISRKQAKILEILISGKLSQTNPDAFLTYDELHNMSSPPDKDLNLATLRKMVRSVGHLIGDEFIEGSHGVGYRLRGTLTQQ